MNESLNLYLTSFAHPWQTQENFKIEREQAENRDLSLENQDESERREKGLSLYEGLTISWLFNIMQTVYLLIGMGMGQAIADQISATGGLISISKVYFGFYTLFYTLLKVVFFPFFFWIYTRFWINIIKLFANLFEKKHTDESVSKQIVVNALTSHTFLIIPIIGELLQQVSTIIYLFAGLRNNYGFSNLQAVLVILCPLLIILFLFFLLMISFAMMIAGF